MKLEVWLSELSLIIKNIEKLTCQKSKPCKTFFEIIFQLKIG